MTALLAITTLVQAPYAISYADPLVGKDGAVTLEFRNAEKAFDPDAVYRKR